MASKRANHRRSSQPISDTVTEETKPNTTKHYTFIYITTTLHRQQNLIFAVVVLRQFENAVTQSANGFKLSVLRVSQVIQLQQWTTAVSKRSLQ